MAKTSTNEQEMPSVAYAVVPSEEDETAMPSKSAHCQSSSSSTTEVQAIALPVPEELSAPASHSMDGRYAHLITPSQTVTWRDDFFQDDYDDIVAVFDFDYQSMERHYRCAGWTCVGATAFCCPNLIPWMLVSLIPCYLNKNVQWSVRSQHMALTTKGLLFVQEKRPTAWGMCYADQRTKMIPFNQIISCTVQDGNHKTCVAVGSGEKLSKISVETNGGTLDIVGLENPLQFQKMVLALKRGSASAQSVLMDDRGVLAAAAAANGEDPQTVTQLLTQIRDELARSNNNSSVQYPPPTAPMATVLPTESVEN